MLSSKNSRIQQKIHKHLVDAVASIIEVVFIEGAYTDKAIERAFKANRKWGSSDRRFVAEAVYDIVRWQRLLKTWAELGLKRANFTAQILWELNWFRKHHHWPPLEYLNSTERMLLESVIGNTSLPMAVELSLPDWLFNYGNDMCPTWPKDLAAMNQQAKVYMRPNSLKGFDAVQLSKTLALEGFKCDVVQSQDDDAVVLVERANVFSSKAFLSGAFEVQDLGSQRIAPLLQVEPGMRVIDACAGAGGKSLHLASLMQNKGSLIALDIHQYKLDELKKRAKRAGCSVIDTRCITSTKVVKRLNSSCDRLLLDVPCTGSGVFRRNPDTKWKLDQERVTELLAIQSDLLQRYALMLKPGGKLVYATCSIFRSENQNQVAKFLAQNSEFRLEHEIELLPHQGDFDGFYAARIVRQSRAE